MKALVWHGKQDIRYETMPDPEIEHRRDAIIKVTSCAICGSDPRRLWRPRLRRTWRRRRASGAGAAT